MKFIGHRIAFAVASAILVLAGKGDEFCVQHADIENEVWQEGGGCYA